jgi:acetyltransferase-like isoleucine patch superfamily enzyme
MDTPFDKGSDPRFAELRQLIERLRADMLEKYGRHVSVGDLLSDRWETARFYGFGEGSSCYDNVLILGDVKVGRNTWIGPNAVLDGSGGLEIGDYCSISAGVQIYSHHTVSWSASRGQELPERRPTRIGSGVYIGPNTIVQMGSVIGDDAVIGAMSLVNCDVPAQARGFGTPFRVQN